MKVQTIHSRFESTLKDWNIEKDLDLIVDSLVLDVIEWQQDVKEQQETLDRWYGEGGA